MRIGIDARELCGRSTGAGRYLAGLLHQWTLDDRARRHDFVLYAPPSLTPESLANVADPQGLSRLDIRKIGGSTGSAGTLWEQFRVPPAAAADRLDVWFAPAYTAPLRLRTPVVVAIHDISFVAHPEWFRFREGVRRRWLTARSAERATAIITISDFSRDEIATKLGVHEKRIHVIPPGVGGFASTGGPDEQPASTGADGRGNVSSRAPRLLYVGSILNRRHVTDLIRAFAPIARRHLDTHLDIVGDNRSYPYEDLSQTVRMEGLDNQVRLHQYVTDAALQELYSNARAFAFLSEYEGLGLTPLEGLAAGAPPVLLDTPVARETCGPAALYVAPHDLPATTAALEKALYDDRARAELLVAAPAVLAKFSWPRAGRETLNLLENFASGDAVTSSALGSGAL